MKTKFIALALAAATALSLTPKPAMAGNKELAIVGGFIGGLIVASAINDHHDDRSTTVIVSDRNGRYEDDCYDRPSGYWREVSVKTWVPARWVIERDRRNCETRRYVAGYYNYGTNRVWVASSGPGHSHREVSRGYGHRR